MTALEELVELAETPYNGAVREWKEKGGKVVGFTCAYIPEEILHAGGILPYRLSPTGCTETTEADLCDGRVFSADGIRAQLSDFFNTMLV